MNQGLKDFYFFSHFLNRKVYSPSGQKVGKIVDLVVERAEPYPRLIGFMSVRGGGKDKTLFFPWEKIASIEPRITLTEGGPLLPRSSLPEEGSSFSGKR